ncbi:hypothetical protein ABZS29_16560 [Kribbella sp. NPDC005582]|uniref:DUF7668 domain-containing protein n=1 Tax=Kribbella sp. NPDC005582 TaxID=3156893 RepID=UPI0033A508BB
MIDRAAIHHVVGIVVGLLVDGEYDVLESLTRRERLTADEIRTAIDEYPGTLVHPPSETWGIKDVIELENSEPPAVAVVVDLWTLEEGESDLSMELELVERYPGIPLPQILNIHVM